MLWTGNEVGVDAKNGGTKRDIILCHSVPLEQQALLNCRVEGVQNLHCLDLHNHRQEYAHWDPEEGD